MLRTYFISAASVLALTTIARADQTGSDAEPIKIAYAAMIEDSITVRGKYQRVENSSAMKTDTALINIPQSLTVLSREQLDDQAITDIAEALRFTPGASTGQGEGHRDQITIRGQNTTADFFIDGLRDDVQYFRPLYNLDRIEILKGANAMIFGRGGGGGVINRVTKTPTTDEVFVGGSLSADTFGSVYASGDVNAPLGEAAAARLNAYYESLDNHRDFFGGDRYAVNPTVAFKLSPATRILASYEYVHDDRTVDRGVPSLNGEPLAGFDETFFGDPDANVTELSAHIARLRIDHEFSDMLKADATVQYADYDKLYQNLYPIGFDDSLGEVSLDGYRDTTKRQNLIFQANLVGKIDTGPLAHKLLIGFEYADQESDNARRDVEFANSMDDQITFAFTDPLVIPAFAFPVFTRDRQSDVTATSVYFQDQIDIGSLIKIIGGVRYDRFEIDAVDQIAIAGGGAGLTSRSDEKWSPRVGVIFKPIESASLYASYSKSFLPRSGDQFLSLSLSSATLAPESFENYEIGAKWDIADTLSVTAAIFQLDRENGLTADPSDPGNAITVGSRTRGFELQFVGEVMPGWSINAGYSYLDGDERGRVVAGALANRTLAQVPEHMFSLWNRYAVTSRFALGLGLTHQSSQFASIGNSVELPGFTRVDAAAFYELSDNLELQVNVENLFDTDYFPAAHNDNNISTGEPLNARFTVRAKF